MYRFLSPGKWQHLHSWRKGGLRPLAWQYQFTNGVFHPIFGRKSKGHPKRTVIAMKIGVRQE